ncbi:unnamed protein product [Rotaria sordida]|uniref:Histone-lysine N-methyltransferase, H3 lysine-79 specific n=1 Tax=Rotaria sordida TaxID=392033 RepID=A0A813X208_9BILA|nr:unnamed protein product [Rotaria sordida]
MDELHEIQNEYSFELIDELFRKFSLRSDDIFIHLGCAYGHLPLQIAAMLSCKKSIGIENNLNLYHSAKLFEKEFSFWMKWFGKTYSDCQIIQGDFFHENFRSILNSGNLIFVNNKSFSNDKNQNLKLRFYDLQSDCRIISTQPFGEPNSRVTARNINDIDSIMSLVPIDNLITNSQLKFYLQIIDYSRIEKYFNGIHRKRKSNLNDNQLNLCQTLFDVQVSSSIPLQIFSNNINSSKKRFNKTKQIKNEEQDLSLTINNQDK